jgi:hypothetical protein
VEEKLDGIYLQETMKEEFFQRELAELSGNSHFVWIWLGDKGHSGGILVGVKDGLHEVEDSEIGEYYTSMVLRDKVTNFRWELISVYGPAQHAKSVDFIAELSSKCLYSMLPLVFGGDFNLIRNAQEKNNGNLNYGLMDRFNMFKDLHQLQEISRCGVKYTWTNRQRNPIMETLNRILVSNEWESRFPCVLHGAKPGGRI